MRPCALQDENFVQGGGLLKGLIANFEARVAVQDETGSTVAYHPDRYIDPDDRYRACIHALFAMIDRDSDLTLGAAEFSKFLIKKGQSVPADLEAQFAKYDTNGNGTIDNDEFAGVVKGLGLDDLVPDAEEAALYMLKAKQMEMRKKRQTNPAVYGHPVWEQRFEFPSLKDGAGLDEAEIEKFKEVYAMGDPTHVGYLGHRQFTDILKMLNIDVDEETLLQMFAEMDENDDGEIDFDEFVPSMVNHIDPEALDILDQISIGSLGTRMWTRGEILWAANTGLLIASGGGMLAGIIYFSFMLVPLTIAYFAVFLFAPIMDFFNHKLKLGPGIGVLGTLVTVAVGFAALGYIVSSELGAIFGDPEFMAKLNGMVDDVYSALNTSGVRVLRETDDRYTAAEISGTIGAFGDSFNLFALIFLLTLYILSEKVEKKMFGDGEGIMPEIETMTTVTAQAIGTTA